jgi:predicted PurR-regulated permease PerM
MPDTQSPGQGSDLDQESREIATAEAARAGERRQARPHLMLRGPLRPQEMFALLGGFGLLALLLVTLINPIIHPVFPLAALLFFLYPFRRETVIRRTMHLGIAAFLVWLAVILSGVLFPFIFAFVLAYLFSPLIGILERRGIRRWISALSVTLLILGIYALIGTFIVPTIIEQASELIQSARGFLKNANWLLSRDNLSSKLTRYGLSSQQAQAIVKNYLEPQISGILSAIFNSLGDFLKNVSAVLEGAFTLILIPIVAFYLMLDFPRIRVFVRSILLQDKPEYVYYVKRVDTILSAYLRGILTTSSMVGALSIGILSALDVPYSIVIGILTGVFNLIPTVGIFINLGIAMIVFLFAPGDFWVHTAITAATILGLHAFNGYFVEPRIIGNKVGVHPVLVIASLFIFAHFLGFVGLLIAVPTTAVILMFLREWYQRTVTLKEPVYTISEKPA